MMMWILQKMKMMRQMTPHMYEETEEPSEEEEINLLASGFKIINQCFNLYR